MTTQPALSKPDSFFRSSSLIAILIGLLLCLPGLASAAPFTGGTSGLSSDLLAILTPIAGIALIVLGVAAWFGKISWWWVVTFVIGIVLFFGNAQIVTWIRGLFGV